MTEQEKDIVTMDDSQTGSIFTRNWNIADETLQEEGQLTNISILAILAFVTGLLSFLAFLSPNFYFIPVVALVLAIIALIRIGRSDGILAGRSFALLGIWLLIIPCVAVPVSKQVYKYRLVHDAKAYFKIWFDTIQTGNILRIKQLEHMPPFVTSPMDEVTYWKQYTSDEMSHEEIHGFLSNKLLLTLATLGNKAKYTYYKTNAIYYDKDTDEIVMTYAVTYPGVANGEKETFFVTINASRTVDEKRHLGVWKGGNRIRGPLPLYPDKTPNPTVKS